VERQAGQGQDISETAAPSEVTEPALGKELSSVRDERLRAALSELYRRAAERESQDRERRE
jgi:hypothetical protein